MFSGARNEMHRLRRHIGLSFVLVQGMRTGAGKRKKFFACRFRRRPQDARKIRIVFGGFELPTKTSLNTYYTREPTHAYLNDLYFP